MLKKIYFIFFAATIFISFFTTGIAMESKNKTPTMPIIKETSLCPPLPEGYQIIPDSLKFSPDLRVVAYAAYAENTQNIVVINDQISSVYYAIYPGTPVFSPDKNRCAYIAYKNKNQAVVVVDGKSSEILEIADNFIFSPDGTRYAFRAQKNNKQFVIIDGVAEPAYDGILIKNNFLFSPDSKRFFYVAFKNNACVAVVDGKEDTFTSNRIENAIFSPDSVHYAYKARIEKTSAQEKWCVVKDGKSGPVFNKIFDIVLSPDSKNLAYAAVKDRKMVMVVDEKEIAEADIMGYPVFSFDSKTFAYAMAKKNKWVIIIDDKKSPSFDQVYKFQFSQDAQHSSYIAKDDDNWFCVVDGNKGPEFKSTIDAFKFSLDSRRYAYAGINKNEAQIVTEKGPSTHNYTSVGEAYFSSDSRHLVFRARHQTAGKWITVLDGQERFSTHQAIGKYEFSSNSKHFAVPVFQNLNQSLMLVDGELQCKNHQFKILGNPYFSPNGDHVVYHGMNKENQFHLIINGEVFPNIYGGFIKSTPIIFDDKNKFHTLALREPGPEFILIEVEIPEAFPKLTSTLE